VSAVEACRACGRPYDGVATDEQVRAHLVGCEGPCGKCGTTRHEGACPDPLPCDVCEEEVECGCDDEWDCYSCGGSGYRVPEHCCDCGGSPYCMVCSRCSAPCAGSCSCPIPVLSYDGDVRMVL
jgi:hypothetical protein